MYWERVMMSPLLALCMISMVALSHAKVVDFDPDVDLLRLLTHKQNDGGVCPNCNPIAGPCDPNKCHLPSCRCSGDDIPKNMAPHKTPQMVIISLQNAVHDHNVNLYLDLFQGRTNPGRDKCSARGTFFVSNQWSSPYAVQLLAHYNHEIAMNGAQDRGVPWWTKASVDDWCQQISDNREILHRYSNIPVCQIRGFRVPNLQMCGNTQFLAYQRCNVTYDGTRVSLNYPKQPNFMWPYTYANISTQDCPIGVCPNRSFPGIWQVPLQALPDVNGVPCSAMGGCKADNESQMYNILKDGFDVKYQNNRAPMMISLDEAFFRLDYKFNALSRFLDYVGTKSGAYIVSASQALMWIKNPKPVDCSCQLFPCPDNKIPLCDHPRTCTYDKNYKYTPRGGTGIIYVIDMCATRCPACYPRSGDASGTRC